MSDRAARIQAFLFAEGGALSLRKLAGLTGVSEAELAPALDELAAHLEGSGLSLVRSDKEAALATAPAVAEALRMAYEAELSRDIGDAGLEVLALLLYRGPSTRAQIDYVRGVNTSSTIRTLLSRGLVERTVNEKDAREYLYRPTAELLAHLGVRTAHELPEHDTLTEQLHAFEKGRHEHHEHTN